MIIRVTVVTATGGHVHEVKMLHVEDEELGQEPRLVLFKELEDQKPLMVYEKSDIVAVTAVVIKD